MLNMNEIRLKMIKNIINNNDEIQIGNHYFKIAVRCNTLYEADYIINGNKTVLGVGNHTECVDYVIECIKLLYDMK